MLILAVLAILVVAVPVHDLVRRPAIRRVALRNLARRKGEAALVVGGAALGTAIIATAFIVGDTFRHSIRDLARTELGPIDDLVTLDDPDQLDAARIALTEPDIDGVDGVAAVRTTEAAIAGTGTDRRAVPDAQVTAADLAELHALGPDISGLAGIDGTPTPQTAVLDATTAATVRVDVGDPVTLHLYGRDVDLEVMAVVPTVGVAGWSQVIVAPDLLERITTNPPAGATDRAAPPRARLLVSRAGGVFDALAGDDVPDAIDQRLTAAGIRNDQDDVKAELLLEADEEEAEITEIFTAIGGFSALAGLLLLANLFVMLAEERKTTLGVLRAVGWRRGRLVRTFTLEGAVYGVLSALGGALLGVLLGAVVVAATREIFAATDSDFRPSLAVEAASLGTAALVGVLVATGVSWVTSWRISAMNIIRAIRDLPEPPADGRGRRVIGGVAIIVIGSTMTVVGAASESPVALMSGVPVAAMGAARLAHGRRGAEAIRLVASIGAAAWSILLFGLFPAATDDPPISLFLIQGVILVGAAVSLASSLGPVLARVVGRRARQGADLRLALAYPVARPFRTGVSLAMFSLIVFSLVYLSVISTAFSQRVDTFVQETAGGHQVLVESSPANPAPIAELGAVPSVASVAPVLRSSPGFSAEIAEGSDQDPERWALSGITRAFTATGEAPALRARPSDADRDVDVFAELAEDPEGIVVAEWFLDNDRDGEPSIGDPVTVHNRAGEARTLTVRAVLEDDWTFAGAFVSASFVEEHLAGEYAANRHVVTLKPGTTAEDGAEQITGGLVEYGTDARSFRAIISEEIERERGFFSLLSGYLGVGLLIGIAGLGVVMARAVRERRAQIGTLKALGLTTSRITRLFVAEGAFLAVQGVVAGAGLGLLASRELLTRSDALGVTIDFVVPWTALAVIVGVPLVAALLAVAGPARRAGRLPAAEALRLNS